MVRLALIFSLSLLAGGGAKSETSAIKEAVRAPVRAFIHRRADALCASFTPLVASHLRPHQASCAAAVEHAFAVNDQGAEIWRPSELPSALEITVRLHGSSASVTTTWPWQRRAHITLVRDAHRWLIATRTTLVEEVTCTRRLLGKRICTPFFGIVFGRTPARVVHDEPSH